MITRNLPNQQRFYGMRLVTCKGRYYHLVIFTCAKCQKFRGQIGNRRPLIFFVFCIVGFVLNW